MRTSKFFLPTFRETPSETEIASHKLMLRAGMIRKNASGIYTWLPLGLKVLCKVSDIIRDEMNKAGALEIMMPAIQPAELWQETGRWDTIGPQLLKIKDRHNRDFCFGPTHEEIITDLLRHELKSYKQLPITFYQIQTKFRDEIRPRFGVMRAREFLMKDAYSFHLDEQSLQETYNAMYKTYEAIFNRIGLSFRAILADPGNIGGKISHEFHVLAESGEDSIAFSDNSDYAANVEIAETLHEDIAKRRAPKETMQILEASGDYSVIQKSIKNILKTIIVEGTQDPFVALVLRGDHELNHVKASKIPEIKSPLRLLDDNAIKQTLGCNVNFVGPIGLPLTMPIIVDKDAALLSDFACGANRDGYLLAGVNWERDLPITKSADIRQVVDGDPSPDGKGGKLHIARGIEVGHIFQLGDRYSLSMKANVLNQDSKLESLKMGCYGIGVSRIVAAAIEQNHDEHGIIWPYAIAPFQIAILPMSLHKSYRVREASETLYNAFLGMGLDVLFDDRKERAGVIFADMELIGIPHLIIIGESNLDNGKVEYKNRKTNQKEYVDIDEIESFLKSRGVVV